jgi:acetoin:2,6-dichlorophenolindophenol oxidoreductase subunit alpha
MPDAAAFFEMVCRIRFFEERLLGLFSEGRLNGTTHTCLGQEATAVGVISCLEKRDLIFASHRCHGHYLARFGDMTGLLAEIMGKAGGVCGGRGGSQHLCRDGFFTNGIQGGYLGIATGMALAEKTAGSGAIVTAFIGDGTLGEGAVYEALNLAALWRVPLLVVVENNGYAQTTPVSANLAGSMAARFAAFGLACGEIESTDAVELHAHFQQIVSAVRTSGRPRVEIVRNCRLGPHSKGDDFRPAADLEPWRRRDPCKLLAARLTAADRAAIEARVLAELQQAEAAATAMPVATLQPASRHALR